MDFPDDPINTIMTGSMGVDGGGFPSSFRGIGARPPTDLEVEENLPSFEEAGFVIININPENVKIGFYGWRYRKDSYSDIQDLKPHHTYTIHTDNS